MCKSKKSGAWPVALALKGVVLALLSGILQSTSGIIVKQLKDIHIGQLAVYRFLFIFAFSLPGTVLSREDPKGPAGYRVLLVLRGLTGASGLFLEFLAFRYLPLGEVTVLIACAPVFVTLFARIFLRESCGVVQSLTVLVTVLGVLLVARIPLKLSSATRVDTQLSDYVIGFLAAIGSTFFSTCRTLLLRKLSCVHSSVVMFHLSWVAVLETAILTALVGDFRLHPCGLPACMIILLGVVSYGGQLLLTLAMQCEQAGPVATVRAASEMASGFLWQICIFGEASDVFGVAGAVLISCSVLVIGIRKWVLSASRESRLFRFCGWLEA